MPEQRNSLNATQSVRLDAVLSLLENRRASSVKEAMLQADAITAFVMTGEIRGMGQSAAPEIQAAERGRERATRN